MSGLETSSLSDRIRLTRGMLSAIRSRTVGKVLHPRLQTRTNAILRSSIRRIIVHREDTDGTLAAIIQYLGLTRQITVAIDTCIASRRHDVSVSEQPACGVEDGLVIVGSAGETRLDEGRVDPAVVGQGGDVGRVD